jgi:hypothetical protein
VRKAAGALATGGRRGKASRSWWAGAALAFAACAAGPQRAATPNAGGPTLEARCYVDVPGTRVTLVDLPGGLELSYSTSPDQVASLRALVRSFARAQNRPDVRGPGTVGDVAVGPTAAGGPLGTAALVPGAGASVDDTPSGARLVLTPVTPAARQLVRGQLEAAARAPLPRSCPPSTLPPSVPRGLSSRS